MLAERLNILNLSVDEIDMHGALEQVSAYVETANRPHAILAVNPEKNYQILKKDPLLYDIFKTADILIPDGIGIVWAAKVLHGRRLSRVPGVELMENICRLSAKKGYKIFVYGGKEDVNKEAVEVLTKRYQGLRIVGRSNGYVKEDAMEALTEKINGSGADILFLALGSPKQEKWFAAHKHALENIRVCQGIGGALDTIAGHVKRAPAIWQRCSAEWLYRLIFEPRRIKRQKVLPVFAAHVLMAWLKRLRGS